MKGGETHEVGNNNNAAESQHTHQKEDFNMKRYSVTALPFATQNGSIWVPDEIVKKGEEHVREYISDNWNDIDFSDPDLDYCGAAFDIYADD